MQCEEVDIYDGKKDCPPSSKIVGHLDTCKCGTSLCSNMDEKIRCHKDVSICSMEETLSGSVQKEYTDCIDMDTTDVRCLCGGVSICDAGAYCEKITCYDGEYFAAAAVGIANPKRACKADWSSPPTFCAKTQYAAKHTVCLPNDQMQCEEVDIYAGKKDCPPSSKIVGHLDTCKCGTSLCSNMDEKIRCHKDVSICSMEETLSGSVQKEYTDCIDMDTTDVRCLCGGVSICDAGAYCEKITCYDGEYFAAAAVGTSSLAKNSNMLLFASCVILAAGAGYYYGKQKTQNA